MSAEATPDGVESALRPLWLRAANIAFTPPRDCIVLLP